MSCGTRDTAKAVLIFAYGGITRYALLFHTVLLTKTVPCYGPTTPEVQVPQVWPGPRSLAATWGISVDVFSSGY